MIGVPKTIDNDLDMTEVTFGFDTAVEVAMEGIDRLFTTATSHSRLFVVEVMGRYAGWIALHAGLAAGAHGILLPEIPFDLRSVAAMIRERESRGARFAIIVVAEGAMPHDGARSVIGQSIGQAERLGGIGHQVAAELEALTGKEARTVVLGHLLRGGTPTSQDRLLGLRFGAAAVRAIDEGYDGVMVALRPPGSSSSRWPRRSAGCARCRSTATPSRPPATSASPSATTSSRTPTSTPSRPPATRWPRADRTIRVSPFPAAGNDSAQ